MKTGIGRKHFQLGSLCRARQEWRRRGRKVVFTNGCFDLLHGGHIHLLTYARQQGDILVVAVNEDASIRKLKGADRPIFPLAERLEILAALECVDALISFPDDTPLRLISEIVPDVLVKGGDWKPEEVVGKPEVEAAGGQVVIVPFRPGHSSSRIIARISGLVGRASSPP
ncbi:MAG: D-glycero-beta-D-manno-heptose 1-phosphate adenylyltransferase [Candidatus Aminicenantaceae bacterium]